MNKKIIGLVGLTLFVAGLGWFFWLQDNPLHPETHKPTVKLVTTTPHPAAPVATGKALPPAVEMRPINAPAPVPSSFLALGVLQRSAILNELSKHNLDYIFQAMLDVGRDEHDLSKQLAIRSILASAMRSQKPPLVFLDELSQFIANDANSRFERSLAIGILENGGTEESTNLLLREATTLKDKELRDTAITTIEGLGEYAINEETSAVLEQAWQTYSDEDLLRSTASSMAQIGVPSAVTLLLSATLAPDGLDDVRREIAQGALTKVYTDSAIPPLVTLLRKSWSATPESQLAGDILAHIGDAKAALPLMSWLQNADASAAPLAHDWIVGTPGSGLLDVGKAALNPAVGFKSEAVRQAIRDGLAEYNSEHTLGP